MQTPKKTPLAVTLTAIAALAGACAPTEQRHLDSLFRSGQCDEYAAETKRIWEEVEKTLDLNRDPFRPGNQAELAKEACEEHKARQKIQGASMTTHIL